MKIISETNFSDIQYTSAINEGTQEKQLFIEGVFAQAELKNRNGRVYPQSVLEKEIERYTKEYVSTGRALGELNHPKYPRVNPEFASHRIVEMWKDGNNFMGKALVLNTPRGNIVKGLLEGGTQLGVSTRGMGSIKESNGIPTVQDDFILSCVDIVSDPSAIDAWVNGILEGQEWVWQDNKLVEISADQAIKQLNKMKNVSEEKLQALFNDYISKI